jgi:hypothetical protein
MHPKAWFSLTWTPLVKIPMSPSCSHKTPKNANYCPTCGVPVGKVSINERISHAIAVEKFKRNEFHFEGIGCQGQTTTLTTWQLHDLEMRILSRKFPQVLFTLTGKNEDSLNAETWRKYYLDGKMQIVEGDSDFDPNLLK